PAVAVVKRGHRWKLVGNAVTVDVAHWIGERLRAPGAVVVEQGRRLSPGRAWPKAAWNVGEGRHEAHASEWPCARPRTELHRFLKFEPEPLSAKATAGFLERTERSSLRFPDGFLDAVRGHLARMQLGASGDRARGAGRGRVAAARSDAQRAVPRAVHRQ